jgi:hypothetical protein
MLHEKLKEQTNLITCIVVNIRSLNKEKYFDL